MEHDLLQNVTERVWLFLPSQDCSIQFLHEEMKLPPPLFPPSLFHLPCALSSVPMGELGSFTKPPKSIKEFLLDRYSLSNCRTFARKNESKTSVEHRGCKRCHWQDRILLSSVFFLPRLDRKDPEKGKPWCTGTVSAESHRWNSGENRGTTTVVRSRDKDRRASSWHHTAILRSFPRAPAEHPRHTLQVRGAGQVRHPPLGTAPGPAVPERCQHGCEGLRGPRGALPAALPARRFTCSPLYLLAALPARCPSCPPLYLPAALPARSPPAPAVPAPAPGAAGAVAPGAAAGQGRGGALRGAGRPPQPQVGARGPGLPPEAQGTAAPGALKALSQL